MSERVVIVGGTSGIGLAAAELLRDRGNRVVVAGRNAERLEAALKVLGEEVEGRILDASDEGQLAAFFAEVGPFDHLVVTVSPRGGITPLLELTAEELRRHSEGKLIPQLLTVKASLGTLRADGSVTLLGAASSQMSAPGLTVLGSSNAALETAARILAVELAPRRVNALSPGVIDTPWWSWLPEENRGAVVNGACANTPLGRPGRPEEVAHAVAFLVENAYTTGIVLPVDGGGRLAS